MTIHDTHPFLEPEPDRDPVRRLRGRLGGTVTLWTAGSGRARTGLTVSSMMLAHGDPAHALALVDPESELAAAVEGSGTAVVQLLEWSHRDLAEAFAGMMPAPGGAFRMASWQETEWGPRLDGASAWAGVRLHEPPQSVGWSLLLDGLVEHVQIEQESEPLLHRRGRYHRLG
jgi:flavin reductase (DIM6/NTAB) family NADH-FMN oxidoreductase RutF